MGRALQLVANIRRGRAERLSEQQRWEEQLNARIKLVVEMARRIHCSAHQR
jgi:hypothetical protein